MDQNHAIAALGALAQDTRLALFRLLVTAGPGGLSAGTIAERLGVAQGVGQALLESGIYDGASGQLLAGSFMDYAMPRAEDLPDITSGLRPVPHQPARRQRHRGGRYDGVARRGHERDRRRLAGRSGRRHAGQPGTGVAGDPPQRQTEGSLAWPH